MQDPCGRCGSLPSARAAASGALLLEIRERDEGLRIACLREESQP